MFRHYQSYQHFCGEFVLPFREQHPAERQFWKALGISKRDIVGVFTFDGRPWKVHADSRVESILAPYLAEPEADDSMLLQVGVTKAVGSSPGGGEKLVPPSDRFRSLAGFNVYPYRVAARSR